jgi:hypothetical protein
VPENLWLIDWEYAAMADPMWDLAYLANETAPDESLHEQLLTFYSGAVDASAVSKLRQMCLLVELVNLAWTAVQTSTPNHGTDFATDLVRRYERTRALVCQEMGSSLQTHLLSYWVRDKQAFTLEEAVRMLTSDNAAAWDLHDRGFVRAGLAADLVLFEEDQRAKVASTPTWYAARAPPTVRTKPSLSSLTIRRVSCHSGSSPMQSP